MILPLFISETAPCPAIPIEYLPLSGLSSSTRLFDTVIVFPALFIPVPLPVIRIPTFCIPEPWLISALFVIVAPSFPYNATLSSPVIVTVLLFVTVLTFFA